MGDAWKVRVLSSNPNQTGKQQAYFETAYRMWSAVWGPELKKISGLDRLHSDAFTRQHEILTLFHGENAAALSLMTRVDLSRQYWLEDSYFQYWPELAIKGLTSKGTDVLVSSYFTVATDYRRNAELPVKELLVGLNVRRLKEIGCAVMTGNMRNTKGLNHLCYDWGATPILKDVPVHGEPSDLVGFFRETSRLASRPELLDPLNRLWETHEVLSESQTIGKAA